ncbi:outer membrane transport family protein [Pseudomonas aeruginosa]|nr:outer membrane transport family protein [Pseudomonas aeruginosa]
MKTIWFKTSLALTISAVSTYTLANGIAINEQSASGAGTAYAGRASSALDASTIYGNPAGLSKLKRTEVSGGLAIVKAKDDISQAHSTAQGSNKGDSVPLAAVPFGYFSTPINEDFTFGLGIYVPYGIINDYENGFMGSSHGSYSKVQVITVQPTIAWKINDKVSVGFGPTFNRIDGQLKNTLATNGLLGSNGDTKINIKGDDTAIGYNVGVMVDLTDDTTWGLTYHSKVKYHLGGNTEVKNAPGALGLNGKYDAKLDITLPESVDTSITHKFDDKWTGYLGAVWTRWSRLEKIEVRNSGVGARPGPGLQHHRRRPELARHLVLLGRYLLPGHPGVGAAYRLCLRALADHQRGPQRAHPGGRPQGLHRRCRLVAEPGPDRRRGLRLPVGNHCRRQPGRQRPAAGLQRQVRQQRAWPDRPGHLSFLIARANEKAGHCPAFSCLADPQGWLAMAFSMAAWSCGSSGVVLLENCATTLPWRSTTYL